MRTRWILILFVLLVAGCKTTEVVVDPNTGETETTYQLDPNAVAQYEAIGEGAVGLLSLFFPAAGGLGLGLLGMWRKLKPQLLEQTKKSEISFKAGQSLATAIEELKTNAPTTFERVAPYLRKASEASTEVEQAIRGFRGLEPKE